MSKCLLDSHWKSCCCTCKYQVLLRDNNTQLPVGYGCAVWFEEEKLVYVGDFDHGVCELYKGDGLIYLEIQGKDYRVAVG